MSLLKAVILGIIQGISEFLPISSSGHLALFQNLMSVSQENLFFDVVLHLGTLIPVFIVLRREILEILKKPFSKITYLLVVATIPIVLFVLLFQDKIGFLFEDIRFLMAGFTLTGLFLVLADKISPNRLKKKLEDITYVDAALIGCMQAVAIAPSISRSGSTTVGALLRGVKRESAAKFVFLLSIPAILGAALLQIKDIAEGNIIIVASDVPSLVFGFTAAALSGYLSMNFMFNLIKKAKLKYFSVYLFMLAAIIFVDSFILGGIIFKTV